MIKELLITCACQDIDKFVTDAFKILFPDKKIPPIHHGIGPMPTGSKYEIIPSLIPKRGKFAYYFFVNTDGELEGWDLIKGVRTL